MKDKKISSCISRTPSVCNYLPVHNCSAIRGGSKKIVTQQGWPSLQFHCIGKQSQNVRDHFTSCFTDQLLHFSEWLTILFKRVIFHKTNLWFNYGIIHTLKSSNLSTFTPRITCWLRHAEDSNSVELSGNHGLAIRLEQYRPGKHPSFACCTTLTCKSPKQMKLLVAIKFKFSVLIHSLSCVMHI